jgi:hemerythrin
MSYFSYICPYDHGVDHTGHSYFSWTRDRDSLDVTKLPYSIFPCDVNRLHLTPEIEGNNVLLAGFHKSVMDLVLLDQFQLFLTLDFNHSTVLSLITFAFYDYATVTPLFTEALTSYFDERITSITSQLYVVISIQIFAFIFISYVGLLPLKNRFDMFVFIKFLFIMLFFFEYYFFCRLINKTERILDLVPPSFGAYMPFEDNMNTNLEVLDNDRKKMYEILAVFVDQLTIRDGIVMESELCYTLNDLKTCTDLVFLMEEQLMRKLKKKMRELVERLKGTYEFFLERKKEEDIIRCKTIMLRIKIATIRMRQHKQQHSILKQRLRIMGDNIMFGDVVVIQGSITPLMSLFQSHFETEDVFVGKVFQKYS